MQMTETTRSSLAREYTLCSNAVAHYKKTLKEFERKYRITTATFLKRFEAGAFGDEAELFDWYASAKLHSQWQKTLSALRTAIQ